MKSCNNINEAKVIRYNLYCIFTCHQISIQTREYYYYLIVYLWLKAGYKGICTLSWKITSFCQSENIYRVSTSLSA